MRGKNDRIRSLALRVVGREVGGEVENVRGFVS